MLLTIAATQYNDEMPKLPTGCAAGPFGAPASAVEAAHAKPPLLTFQDAIDFVNSMDCSLATQTVLKTALRQIAWGVTVITTRDSGRYLDPNRRNLDFSRIPFDLPAINRALAGVRFRMAGFSSDKSLRNAKSGLRRIGRELGLVAPHRARDLPLDNPYAPLLAAADPFEVAAARRFAARMMDEGRHPHDVTGDDLARYGAFLATELVGVRVDPMLRRIVQLWRRAAESNPSWPQIPLSSGKARSFNPPFAAYPQSLQDDIAGLCRWMEGTGRLGPFQTACVRKPLRSATIKLRLHHVRLILGVYGSLGDNLAPITRLRDLLSPAVIQPILQAIWERGQVRQQALPEDERAPAWSGNTSQLGAVGVTLLMLLEHLPPAPDVLTKIQALIKMGRTPRAGGMTRKNRKRVDQFLDPLKRGLLLNLPRILMAEALELREHEPAEAARLARAAIFFAIELRIPLRMKNLHTIRIGHNLRFAGGGSGIGVLSFQDHEMKNHQAIEFSVGSRLAHILQLYIQHFLPVFAANAVDFAAKQWLFPAGPGKSGPLSHGQVRKTIIDTVAERIGAEFHPHLFRALAVDFCLQHDPGALEHCRQLLGDKTLQVVLTSYTPMRTKQAADRQDRLVNEEADRLASLAPCTRRPRKAVKSGQSAGR